jgi:hypothetical protein
VAEELGSVHLTVLGTDRVASGFASPLRGVQEREDLASHRGAGCEVRPDAGVVTERDAHAKETATENNDRSIPTWIEEGRALDDHGGSTELTYSR